MKTKRLLRFYFRADALEGAIDNLILRSACLSAGGTNSGEYYAGRILSLIAAKDELSELWNYLDGVMQGLGQEDRQTLQYYSALRHGISRLGADRQRAIRRSVIKFKRHARAFDRFAEGIRLVGEYYCLM